MSFLSSLIGNQKNEKTLAAWKTSGRFPHALLLTGLPGSGRTTFAYQIAATLLCQNPQAPCGSCSTCQKVQKHIYPDIHVLEGEGGARSFHISQIRALREEAFRSANDGDTKIFLLKQAENLSVQAQNALLKLIEEPPTGVFFILTSGSKQQLLPTILSRVTALSMPVLPAAAKQEYLEQQFPGYTAEQYRQAATRAETIGSALQLLQADNDTALQEAATLWEALKQKNPMPFTVAFSQKERQKESFLNLLIQLRTTIYADLSVAAQQPNHAVLLQWVQIAAIIEAGEKAVAQNANLLLLGSLLSCRITALQQ